MHSTGAGDARAAHERTVTHLQAGGTPESKATCASTLGARSHGPPSRCPGPLDRGQQHGAVAQRTHLRCGVLKGGTLTPGSFWLYSTNTMSAVLGTWMLRLQQARMSSRQAREQCLLPPPCPFGCPHDTPGPVSRQPAAAEVAAVVAALAAFCGATAQPLTTRSCRRRACRRRRRWRPSPCPRTRPAASWPPTGASWERPLRLGPP